jgi:hypothetical protein
MDFTIEGTRIPQEWYIYTVKSIYQIKDYIYSNIYIG